MQTAAVQRITENRYYKMKMRYQFSVGKKMVTDAFDRNFNCTKTCSNNYKTVQKSSKIVKRNINNVFSTGTNIANFFSLYLLAV